MTINYVYQPAKIQKSYLIIPATSTGIERAFSTAGLTLNDRRNRLIDIMFEQMLIAKLNDDLMLVRDMFIRN